MAIRLDTFNRVIFITFCVGLLAHYNEGSLQEQYIGCYRDISSQSNWTNGIIDSDTLSVELCIESCKQRNTTYAILQNGRNCLCGDALNTSSPDFACDTPCSGNDREVCGGSSRSVSSYVIYSVCPFGYYGAGCDKACHCNQQIPCNFVTGICPNGCERNWTLETCSKETSQSLSDRRIGCYADSWDRAMEYRNDPPSCTLELCSSVCASNTYTYAGTQNSAQCFCGEAYAKHGSLPDSKCNFGCDGDVSEMCGGDWALSVYFACPIGYFGKGCMSRCNCKNEQRCTCAGCTCSSGCKSGWMGSRCEFRNCSENNGGCSGNETCVTVDLKSSTVNRYIDECILDVCDPNTTNCTNAIGNFTCSCLPGYERINTTHCKDIDECKLNPKPCNDPERENCSNTIGSYFCVCQTGYNRHEKNGRCEDEDECKHGRCDKESTLCNNTMGSFVCTCLAGYEFNNGISCRDTDECRQVDVCKNVNSTCKNTVGSFECSCFEGYESYNKTSCKQSNAAPISSKVTAGQIAGAVIGSIVGVILILVVVFLLLRYFRQKRENNTDDEIPINVRGTSAGNLLRGDKVKSLYSVASTPTSTALNTIRSKLADPGNLEREFEFVQTKTKDFSALGAREDMKTKNRFINIIPYDWNRVVLSRTTDDDASGYINASYIQGYNDSDKFIATQGPRVQTVNDFWRMICEKEIRLIVMITKLVENQKVKCEKYWPNVGQSIVYGDITVTVKSEDSWPDYTVRQIQANKNSETIELAQWQYMAWSDHGVPTDAKGFLEFRRKIRQHVIPDKYTLVHCSAGAGRTGTFIAIDYLLEQEKVELDVDVHGCLKQMRDQRSSMIQNLAQYKFVHTALLIAFTVRDTAVPVERFLSTYKSWQDKKSNSSDKSELEEQFETIESTKNDPAEIGRHRVLSNSVQQNTVTEMDAVFVQSWKQKDAYISMKLPDSPNDFWTLRREQKSVIVIFIDGPTQGTEAQFLPTKAKPIICKDCMMMCESETSEDYGSRCIVTEYKNTDELYANATTESTQIYENAGQNSERTPITVLQVTEPLTNRSGDKDSLFSLYKAVQITSAKNSFPVMVVTRTDCSLNGFCLAAFNAFEMIEHEKEVDLYQIVLNIRKSKPELFNSMVSFVELHDLIGSHIRVSTA